MPAKQRIARLRSSGMSFICTQQFSADAGGVRLKQAVPTRHCSSGRTEMARADILTDRAERRRH